MDGKANTILLVAGLGAVGLLVYVMLKQPASQGGTGNYVDKAGGYLTSAANITDSVTTTAARTGRTLGALASDAGYGLGGAVADIKSGLESGVRESVDTIRHVLTLGAW
jgi:hypothetical protein